MKINETQRIGAVNPYQKQNDKQAESASRKRKKDEVQISAEAQEMLSSSRENSTDRTKLIDSLKQSVSSGTYHVEAGKIAEKLLPFIK
ncbi:negative regulator of flagellin synthesis [Paenibacillus baekrokdamisoli]|uniref:Negative regulator of flagellin synthesis n=1 Tax=Paenibacillus baekrokdamisoli TaxID=1712516 RepID=A0A3G9J025_9BACL|nr:flagellar biosynthesis anti-sigma factor FlgM [Paenibacillus baekrokdamisoli]MBB3069088.1 negative regulator of flagellin synthesis FlgM [Paenibacillus baekrokdamisoli]BBH23902.1 negative regulator of flagellin synthesis [Paenibacillus baekrokdamisoli]